MMRGMAWHRHAVARMVWSSFVAGLLVLGFVGAGIADTVEPPGDVRDRLTVDELLTGAPNRNGPIHNGYFMPVGDAGPARHAFEGTLGFIGAGFLKGTGRFPGFSATFFTSDGYLVPVERDIIRSSSGDWDIIVSPGRVWSEPADDGWSRASFPFTLVGRKYGESRNGLAVFLFNDTEVSDLTFQIVQESASWSRFDAWSRIRLIYRPGPVEAKPELAAAFADELARRLPTAPLTSLDVRDDLLDGLERDPQHVTVTALLDDGVLYMGPCRTRFGDYPYCDEMRHGVQSVTKTAGAALSLLWLAEKYGPEVFDLKIVDYLDVTADHDGWNDVTFRDAINMATGIGENAPVRDVKLFDAWWADETLNSRQFYDALSAQLRLQAAFMAGDYGWGPDEVLRYNSQHTFVLAAAMDAYLKSMEGPGSNLWDSVFQEVLSPIGVGVAPMLHTTEPDNARGVPFMGWGYLPTTGELAKIAQLYQNRGVHEGQQLLYGDEIDLLLRGDPEYGFSTLMYNFFGQFSYDFSFWYMAYDAEGECSVRIPQMMGYGRNLVMLMPNGMIGIRLADADQDAPEVDDGESLAALSSALHPFCEDTP